MSEYRWQDIQPESDLAAVVEQFNQRGREMDAAFRRLMNGSEGIRDAGGLVYDLSHPRFELALDGVREEAAEAQAVIDFVAAAGGGIIRLPPNSTLLVGTSLEIPSDTHLKGAGSSSVIKATAGLTTPLIKFAGTSPADRVLWAGIHDLLLDLADASSNVGAHGIFIEHATGELLIRNIRIVDAGGWAIVLNQDTFFVDAYGLILSDPNLGGVSIREATPGSPCNDNSFREVSMTWGVARGQKAIEILAGTGGSRDNKFTNWSDQSVKLQNGLAVIDIQASDNQFIGYRHYDQVETGSPLGHVHISGAAGARNRFVCCSTAGGPGYPSIRLTGGCNGNVFVQHQVGGTSSTVAGVYFADSSSVDNYIELIRNDLPDNRPAGTTSAARFSGSSRIRGFDHRGLGFGVVQELVDLLGHDSSADIGTHDMRVGRYLHMRNQTGGARGGGWPVRPVTNAGHHKTFEGRNIDSGLLIALAALYTEDGDVASGAWTPAVEFGRVRADIDASLATAGDPVYWDPATGGLTLSVPATNYAIVVGWVQVASNPAELLVKSNFLSEYARHSRLGMRRFTANPAVGGMEEEEVAVGVVGGTGRLYYKSGGTIYVFDHTSTIT